MARVYPGSDFQDIYDARGIVSGNIQGDDYKVRRSANDSNLDPRTNSQWQDKIIDAMSLASRIWSNKRNCWKDHFKRSKKTFSYDKADNIDYYQQLTGYKLAINIIMQTLKTGGVEFYDPRCFCVTPTDLFGEPLNVYSKLDIKQITKLTYEYLEQKLPFDALQPEGSQYDKFCSAVGGDPGVFEKCLLSSVGGLSRDNSDRDISKVKNIVQWPPIWFEPGPGADPHSFGIWYNDFFTYYKIPVEDLPVTDGSMRGYQITLGYPFSGNSLCSIGNLQITLYYQYDKVTGFIQDTPTEPFYDIYWDDILLGRFGAGGGGYRITPLDVSTNLKTNLLNGSNRKITWGEYIYPVIPGYQSNMYPPGKLTECRLMSTVPEGEKYEGCMWDRIYQYWDCGTQIDFHHGDPTVLVKFNFWRQAGCSDGTIFCAHPYGAIHSISGSNDMNEWFRVMGSNQIWPIPGTSSSMCMGTSQYHFPFEQSYRYFRTIINSAINMVLKGPCGTLIGDPSCFPYPIDEECEGPAPGQRGLFFLEKLKPFEIKPVACRCPEFFCPPEFPESGPNPCTLSNITRCPEDHRWAKIGDTCVPCVGASNRGLVYDYLR